MKHLDRVAGLEHALAEPAAAFGLQSLDDFHLALLEDMRRLFEEMCALGERQRRPFGKGGMSRLDRGTGFRAAAIGHFRPDRTVGGIEVLEHAAALRAASNELAFENACHLQSP